MSLGPLPLHSGTQNRVSMNEQAPHNPQLPQISVIIPHYNDFAQLDSCIDSLRHQTYPRECFEIVVADNNSVGGVEAVKQVAPDVRVIPAPEQGAGPARNAGTSVAGGTYLAFIDSDCIAHSDWLHEGLEALKQFDYVGGQVITTVRDRHSPSPTEAFEAVFAFNFKKYIERDKFTGSGNLFVPKLIFEKVGGFRPRVSEDVEWCHRANAMGFRLGYAEKAIVYHPARRTWSDLVKRWDRVMLEDIHLAIEQPSWQLRWLAHAALVIASPLAHWLPIMRSTRLVGPRAKARGLAALFGIRIYRGYRMISLLLRRPK